MMPAPSLSSVRRLLGVELRPAPAGGLEPAAGCTPAAVAHVAADAAGAGRWELLITTIWLDLEPFLCSKDLLSLARATPELRKRVTESHHAWNLWFVKSSRTLAALLRGPCSHARDLRIAPQAAEDWVLLRLARALGPHLRRLDLSHCSTLTDAALLAIGQSCPHLESLDLQKCYEVTDRGLAALASGCHRLTRLNLRLCFNVTDVGLESLAQGCPLLTHLDLRACSRIGDESLSAIALRCRGLCHLDVWLCEKVTDTGVMAIAEGCPSLSYLRLRGCAAITDTSLASLCALRGLESLDLHSCVLVTSEGVRRLLQAADSLASINLSYCWHVAEGVLSLLSDPRPCPRLSKIDLTYCYEISRSAVKTVQLQRPGLEVQAVF